MTVVARVCEKWTMQLTPPPEEHEPWFLDWVLRSPKQAGRHLTAGWLAYSAVHDAYPTPDTMWDAHECFGGMGAQGLMIQELFHPRYHTVGEISWEGVKHLETVLPDAHVSRADAYDPTLNLSAVDLVGLDFGDLTVWKAGMGKPHRQLLERTFRAQPKAVVFTDIACRYLHLHRNRYESVLGEGSCVDYETYLYSFLSWIERKWDYTLLAGWWDRWSAVMALVPAGSQPPGRLLPTPDKPVGLELF